MASTEQDGDRRPRGEEVEPRRGHTIPRRLLSVFTASTLAIVALVVLVAAIGSWWTLVPIMAVDFAVTAAVLITVAKLLEDAGA